MNETFDCIRYRTNWKLEKRRVGEKDFYEVLEWPGNLLLNEGINLLCSLLAGGAGQAYDNAHAYIGVGDSGTAAAAAQTGLQAATNKAWAAMEVGYPTYGTNQRIAFKAVFADGVAEFAWQEFSVGNSVDDSGENLNRKVESKGTKGAGEVWGLTCTITFS
jgi:hypothetical protein